jgi:hypothetical protein
MNRDFFKGLWKVVERRHARRPRMTPRRSGQPRVYPANNVNNVAPGPTP